MTEYAPQVDKSHYVQGSYRAKDRWISYFYQLMLVRKAAPQTVLEIGPGEKVVTQALMRDGVEVTTLDISPDLSPDIVGSVTEITLPEKSFDVILAAEILEHIHIDDVPRALAHIARVARTHVVISLPHAGYTFAFEWKVPLLPRTQILFKVPFFWKTHVFNGEHYWELGKKGYSVKRFVAMAREAGLECVVCTKFADDPAHQFFLFSVARI